MTEPRASLHDWPLGTPATVVTIGRTPADDGDPGLAAQLARLGLRCGMTLTPRLCSPGRGLVVEVGDARLALDRKSTRQLVVQATQLPREPRQDLRGAPATATQGR